MIMDERIIKAGLILIILGAIVAIIGVNYGWVSWVVSGSVAGFVGILPSCLVIGESVAECGG